MTDLGGYSHATNPRAAPPARPKLYRPDASASLPSNMMFDSRIRRGNTYGGRVVLAEEPPPAATKRLTYKKPTPSVFDLRPGAKESEPISLEPFLVEQLEEKEITEVSTQTDEFTHKPLDAPYVPQKTGIDAGTQVDDRLFDFDVEVSPILDVIVGKTLEQGLLEVDEEEALFHLAVRKQELKDGQQAERKRISAMESKESEKWQRKQTLLNKAREKRRQQEQALAKIAARSAASALARAATDKAFAECHRLGEFTDPVTIRVRDDFIPWLYTQVDARLHDTAVAAQCAEDVLKGAFDAGRKQYDARMAEVAARRAEEERIRKEREAELRKYIRIFLRIETKDLDTRTVGPVKLERAGTVGQAEKAISEWLAEHMDDEWMIPEGGFRLGSDGAPLPRAKTLLQAAGEAPKAKLDIMPDDGGEEDEEDD